MFGFFRVIQMFEIQADHVFLVIGFLLRFFCVFKFALLFFSLGQFNQEFGGFDEFRLLESFLIVLLFDVELCGFLLILQLLEQLGSFIKLVDGFAYRGDLHDDVGVFEFIGQSEPPGDVAQADAAASNACLALQVVFLQGHVQHHQRLVAQLRGLLNLQCVVLVTLDLEL